MSSNSSGEDILQNDEFSEKSYYKRLISSFKQLLHSVFFALSNDQTNPSTFFYLLIILLRFSQMIYFHFHFDVNNKKFRSSNFFRSM